jgi:hypothetical protein
MQAIIHHDGIGGTLDVKAGEAEKVGRTVSVGDITFEVPEGSRNVVTEASNSGVFLAVHFLDEEDILVRNGNNNFQVRIVDGTMWVGGGDEGRLQVGEWVVVGNHMPPPIPDLVATSEAPMATGRSRTISERLVGQVPRSGARCSKSSSSWT